jgi:hypothetical protein
MKNEELGFSLSCLILLILSKLFSARRPVHVVYSALSFTYS